MLTQAAKPQSPQSFTDSPPYSPLFWFGRTSPLPLCGGISFTLCSSLSQSLYKGLGAGVGGGQGELDPNWLSPPGRDQSGEHAPSR